MNTIVRPDTLDASARSQSSEPPRLGWGSDVAAAMLRRLNIPFVTLNPGASYRGFHDSLVNYLGNSAPELLLCLNEDHVVSIAHGYAKVTDQPIACVLHSNVGLLHGAMGLFNAWCDRAPILVLGATGPVAPEKRRPWIDWIHTAKDQGALIRNFVKWDDEPRSVPGIVEAILRGWKTAATKPTAPVYVCLDAGLQEQPLGGDVTLPDPSRFAPPAPPEPAPQDVAALADAIATAKRPVLLFGRGGRSREAWDRRVALAEHIGARVLTSIRERAVFPTDHPLHAAPPFNNLNAAAKAVLADADLIVSFDWVDLNGTLSQVWRTPADSPARIVHVSLDSLLHNGWSMDYFGLPPADIHIQADADTVLARLAPLVIGRSDGEAHEPRRVEPVATAVPPAYSPNAEREIGPRDIEVALARLRGEEAWSLAHVTIGWAGDAYRFRDPLDFLGHDGGAGLGAGPGLTVGAALALKDSGRVVVSVLGDGDFLQGVTALWTAARYRLPALFVVANNRSNFNDEIHQEAVARVRGRPVENRWIGQRIDDPAVDITGIARAQGVAADDPVTSVPQLEAAIRRGLAVVRAGTPYLIDARVTPGYATLPLPRGG